MSFPILGIYFLNGYIEKDLLSCMVPSNS